MGLFGGNCPAGYSGTFSAQIYGQGDEFGLVFRMTGGPGRTIFGAAAGRQ